MGKQKHKSWALEIDPKDICSRARNHALMFWHQILRFLKNTNNTKYAITENNKNNDLYIIRLEFCMHWRLKPFILLKTPSMGRRGVGRMSLLRERMGEGRGDWKSLNAKRQDILQRILHLPKMVLNLLVGANICGQIFNVGSEWKYKIKQKQATGDFGVGGKHTHKIDRNPKFSLSLPRRKSANTHILITCYLSCTEPRNLLYIFHFFSHWCSEGEIISPSFRWKKQGSN